MHPLNMTRDKFFQKVKEIKAKGKKGLLIAGTKIENQLIKNLSTKFKTVDFDIHKTFR